MIIIGNDAPSIADGFGADTIENMIYLQLSNMKKMGNGLLVEYIKRNA